MAVAVSPSRPITQDEQQTAATLLARARGAMRVADAFDQATVDRLCRAVAWAGGNELVAARLANMSVDESGMGSREPRRRAKVLGILRDALRQKSIGVIEEIPDKGIVKYAKPAGVIAALVPVTSPYVTPVGIAIYAIKCRDAVIFSPHPASRKTTNEVVRVMREGLAAAGAPPDLLQCVERPSIPLAQELMRSCDLTIATGGPAMVKSAYGSGKPAYGVGAGNATMVIDETADIEQAARNSADEQDERPRIGLLGRRQPARGCPNLRRVPCRASARRRLPGQRRARKRCCRPRTGTTPAIARPRHDRAACRDDRPAGRLRRFRTTRRSSSCPRNADRERAPVLDREARRRDGRLQVSGVRDGARPGAPHLRDRRPGAFLRDLLVRRRPYPPAGARRAREPHHGPAGAIDARTPGHSPTACR